ATGVAACAGVGRLRSPLARGFRRRAGGRVQDVTSHPAREQFRGRATPSHTLPFSFLPYGCLL
ncbi:MAG: hypothetical protein ACUVS4_11230, partial [Chloroflexaceae bacterium]